MGSFCQKNTYHYWNKVQLKMDIFAQKEAWLRRNITEGMIAVDAGACIGEFTTVLAELVGEKGRVFAFEPVEDNFAKLTENTKKLGNVTNINAALGDIYEKKSFYLGRAKGWGSLYKTSNTSGEVVKVQVISLDSILEKFGIYQIDIFKIDVEGYELNVLRGAQSTIFNSEQLAILIEVHLTCGQLDIIELFEFFAKGINSFMIYSLDHKIITTPEDCPSEIIALKDWNEDSDTQ